nr:hypothetical protein GCM10017611_52540 [Rhodococcus wratislaviensis]
MAGSSTASPESGKVANRSTQTWLWPFSRDLRRILRTLAASTEPHGFAVTPYSGAARGNTTEITALYTGTEPAQWRGTLACPVGRGLAWAAATSSPWQSEWSRDSEAGRVPIRCTHLTSAASLGDALVPGRPRSGWAGWHRH